MKLRLLSLVGIASLTSAFIVAGCSDDDTVINGGGGANGSSTAGKGSGGTTGTAGDGSGGEETEAEGGTGPAAAGHGGKSGTGGSHSAGDSGSSSGGAAEGGSGGKGGSGGAAVSSGAGAGGFAGTAIAAGAGGLASAAAGTGGVDAAAGSGGGCSAPYTGTLVYNFDSGGVPAGWGADAFYATTDTALAGSTVARNASEGKFCPGALQGTFPFSSYAYSDGGGESGQLRVYATNDWTGKTKLHAWAKVDISQGTSHFNYIELFANSDGYSHYVAAKPTPVSAFTDGLWHEIVLDLGPGSVTFDKTHVVVFGLRVTLQATAPSAGPATPPPVNIYLDDVWLE